MTAPASARHADDPKSWTERALTARDLRYAVALDRIEDLTRAIPDNLTWHVHSDTCHKYSVLCLAHRIQTILKEES